MEDLKTILWLCMLVAAFLSGKMLAGWRFFHGARVLALRDIAGLLRLQNRRQRPLAGEPAAPFLGLMCA